MPQNFAKSSSYVVPVKSKVNISQNFVAFSEYMNFMTQGKSRKIFSGSKSMQYFINAIDHLSTLFCL